MEREWKKVHGRSQKLPIGGQSAKRILKRNLRRTRTGTPELLVLARRLLGFKLPDEQSDQHAVVVETA